MDRPLMMDRYDIIRPIGRGGQGELFLARDLEGDCDVALKRLSMRSVADWKAIELFEREAKVLRSLDHPSIPAYVGDFIVGAQGDEPQFFLAQAFVDGESLADIVADGGVWGEAEARDFLGQMLDVLAYLGELHPPIVHRDIKPDNIIRREDGSYALVDFGAVQAIMPADAGGSTVVGTSGYLPVEQIMGRAMPCSDLYALGATVVHVMSGMHPADLSAGGLEVDFRDAVDASEPFLDLLSKLLAPYPEDRLQTAVEARERLLELPDRAPRDAEVEAELSSGDVSSDDLLAARGATDPEVWRSSQVQKMRRFRVEVDGDQVVIRTRSLAPWVAIAIVVLFISSVLVAVFGDPRGALFFGGFFSVAILFEFLHRGRVVIGPEAITVDRRRVGLVVGHAEIPIDRLHGVIFESRRIKFLDGAAEYSWGPFYTINEEKPLARLLQDYLAGARAAQSPTQPQLASEER